LLFILNYGEKIIIKNIIKNNNEFKWKKNKNINMGLTAGPSQDLDSNAIRQILELYLGSIVLVQWVFGRENRTEVPQLKHGQLLELTDSSPLIMRFTRRLAGFSEPSGATVSFDKRELPCEGYSGVARVIGSRQEIVYEDPQVVQSWNSVIEHWETRLRERQDNAQRGVRKPLFGVALEQAFLDHCDLEMFKSGCFDQLDIFRTYGFSPDFPRLGYFRYRAA
jgi:hypothetical protein